MQEPGDDTASLKREPGEFNQMGIIPPRSSGHKQLGAPIAPEGLVELTGLDDWDPQPPNWE